MDGHTFRDYSFDFRITNRKAKKLDTIDNIFHKAVNLQKKNEIYGNLYISEILVVGILG